MVGVAVVVAAMASPSPAEAASPRSSHASTRSGSYASAIHSGMTRTRFASFHRGRYGSRRWGSVLQCVPFARENSGIELSGNAGTWWDGADGVYERGARPEVGSVLNFRATGRIRMGHVAVVTNVVNSRRIEIDHANWGGPGRVSRNIDVVDVSPSNDWTAVRVALDHNEEFGSIYPTYGFIYDRPDRGVMVANANRTAAPTLNPAPADDRFYDERTGFGSAAAAPEEVAEAADDTVPRSFRHRRTAAASAHARGRAAAHAGVYRVSNTHPAARRHARRL